MHVYYRHYVSEMLIMQDCGGSHDLFLVVSNTTGQNIFLEQLRELGIGSTFLHWFHFYPRGHFHCFAPWNFFCSVPQGSILSIMLPEASGSCHQEMWVTNMWTTHHSVSTLFELGKAVEALVQCWKLAMV